MDDLVPSRVHLNEHAQAIVARVPALLVPADEAHPLKHYFGQQHLYDEDQPEVHALLRSWRRILDQYGARIMVGEVYLFDLERVAAFYGNGHDELALAFNFGFLWSPWSAAAFRQQVDRMEALLPSGAQPTYVLSSHDAPRSRTRFDDPIWGQQRARVAAMMLLTLRGTPFFYYGEEIGMRDVAVPSDRICDPVGKRFPMLNRDPERTPMQWSAAHGAGFTTAPDSWLPIAPDSTTVNVARQFHDPRSHLSFFRRLIWFRKQATALRQGGYRPIDGPADTFVFHRESDDQRLLVALNFASEPRVVDVRDIRVKRLEISTDGERVAGPLEAGHLKLGPVEGVIVSDMAQR